MQSRGGYRGGGYNQYRGGYRGGNRYQYRPREEEGTSGSEKKNDNQRGETTSSDNRGSAHINMLSMQDVENGGAALDRDMRIRIRVNGIEVDSQIDTGSFVSVMGKDFYEKLKKEDPSIKITPEENIAKSVNGNIIECLGKTALKV